jgi:hypothetical protein
MIVFAVFRFRQLFGILLRQWVAGNQSLGFFRSLFRFEPGKREPD